MKKILVGLDIGKQTIKAVQLSKDKGTNYLMAAGYIATPPQIFSTSPEGGVLDNSINRLVHDMKVTSVEVVA